MVTSCEIPSLTLSFWVVPGFGGSFQIWVYSGANTLAVMAMSAQKLKGLYSESIGNTIMFETCRLECIAEKGLLSSLPRQKIFSRSDLTLRLRKKADSLLWRVRIMWAGARIDISVHAPALFC